MRSKQRLIQSPLTIGFVSNHISRPILNPNSKAAVELFRADQLTEQFNAIVPCTRISAIGVQGRRPEPTIDDIARQLLADAWS